jgi:hypothetical protein
VANKSTPKMRSPTPSFSKAHLRHLGMSMYSPQFPHTRSMWDRFPLTTRDVGGPGSSSPGTTPERVSESWGGLAPARNAGATPRGGGPVPEKVTSPHNEGGTPQPRNRLLLPEGEWGPGLVGPKKPKEGWYPLGQCRRSRARISFQYIF